tara:strand:+ start:247 stop:420 length:174 start_codon:yes stop_codon:yes gene_type:complete
MEDQELQQLEEAVLRLLSADNISEEYDALLTNEERFTYLCEIIGELANLMDEEEQEQ